MPSETCLCAIRRMTGEKSGASGVDELHGEGHDRGRERLRLLADRLVGAVEDAQQLGVGGEHRRVEDLRDLFGVLGDDARGGADDGFGLR